MFTQIALILSLIILIFFIYKFAMFKPQVVLTPLEYFNSRKRKILEYLNNYKVKLNVSIPPLTCTDLDKNYNIEEFEVMKQTDPDKFKKYISCGYVHNVYLLTAFEEWINNSLTHSDVSFENFQYLCIRPPVDISTVDFKNFRNYIKSCIQTNKTNVTYW